MSLRYQPSQCGSRTKATGHTRPFTLMQPYALTLTPSSIDLEPSHIDADSCEDWVLDGPAWGKRAPIRDALLTTTLNPHPSNKGHWSHPLRTPASHKCGMMGRWTHLGAIFRNDRELLCSSSEVGSYLRLTDFVYHSTLGLRVKRKKKKLHPSLTTLYPHPSTPALELNTVHPPHGGV